MLDFNFEEFKEELKGLSFDEQQETIDYKIAELETLHQEIDDALEDVYGLRVDKTLKHENDVWNDVVANIVPLANGRPSIVVDDNRRVFNVKMQDGYTTIQAFSIDEENWSIIIKFEFFKFFANNAKRHEKLTELAKALDLTYMRDLQIKTDVPENQLKETLVNILTKLSE